MPCDYQEYPEDWFTRIRPAILERAGNRCEGSPDHPHCRAENGRPHPTTGAAIALLTEVALRELEEKDGAGQSEPGSDTTETGSADEAE